VGEHDVVVVGAGPAGSTTALRLARAGFSVVMLDAKRFPRFKPCGEFMSPEVLPMLREIGLDEAVRAAGAREVRGMLLHAHGQRVRGRFVSVGRAAAPVEHGWAVRREVFDEILVRGAQRAGAELYEGVRVTRLLRDGDGRVLGVVARSEGGAEREFRGSFTIGADGVRSCVASELGVVRPTRWLQKIALTTRFEGVDWGDFAEVHLLEGHDRGFFACAPVDGGLTSVNLVLEQALFEREGLARDQAFDAWLDRTPELGARLRCGPRVDPVRGIGPLATTTTAQIFDGAVLVGDACGYVDPITGEGIFFAIKGGELLAGVLFDALHGRRRDRAALFPYLSARRRELAPRAAFATLLQRGLRHPRLVRAAFALLASRPNLADVLVSVTGDYVPLRELARPSVVRAALSRRAGAAT
jgi:geranylgeranyl reductase family protein